MIYIYTLRIGAGGLINIEDGRFPYYIYGANQPTPTQIVSHSSDLSDEPDPDRPTVLDDEQGVAGSPPGRAAVKLEVGGMPVPVRHYREHPTLGAVHSND